MSDEDRTSEDDIESIDDVDVLRALRAAMKPPESESKTIQHGVQKRIRDESKGRFFADGWSTSAAPRATFLVTSVLMLVVVLLAYYLLSPRGLELLR
jgi:hypothetical protein